MFLQLGRRWKRNPASPSRRGRSNMGRPPIRPGGWASVADSPGVTPSRKWVYPWTMNVERTDDIWLDIPGQPKQTGLPTVSGLALMEALQRETGPDRLERAVEHARRAYAEALRARGKPAR